MSTIASYYMQATDLPKAILVELDNICNNFLWGEFEGKKKMHLIENTHTFLPKSMGGLGIRSHVDLNMATLSKLGLRMCQGPQTLAKECINSSYSRANYNIAYSKGSQV